MSEEGANFALWGDETKAVEDELDIPRRPSPPDEGVANEDSDRLSGVAPAWTTEEQQAHDRHGYRLCQELQAFRVRPTS